jgi:glucan phosphoethanolaminetransferase (alkaline phosphatase superfamily)
MVITKSYALGALFTLLALLMLPNLVLCCVSTMDLTVVIGAIVIPMILLACYFAVLGRRIWLACLLVTPFATLCPLEVYYIVLYRRPSSVDILGTVSLTNPSEVVGYFGWWKLGLAVLCAMGCLALSLYAAWSSYRADLRWSGKMREYLIAGALAFPLVLFVVGSVHKEQSQRSRWENGLLSIERFESPVMAGYPFGVISRFWYFHEELTDLRAQYAQAASSSFHATQDAGVAKRQIYVLVIGESSRRDHWQLFGYGRATNPELASNPNIVPISNMLGAWSETIAAVPLILTRKPMQDRGLGWHEASILSAMREAGYDTWWVSNQLPLGKGNSLISLYALEAKHQLYVDYVGINEGSSYDEALLEPLAKILADKSQQRVFVVLHMLGSHVPYDLRYPPAFKRFVPALSDAGRRPGAENFSNSYDNTVLYTDHVLSEVIGMLVRSGAVSALWYESDHGEMLPTSTCNLDGHRFGTRYEYMIPALFWYSDEYKALFPDRIEQLRANANKSTVSASTFESLIDMAGIDFPGHDETWSLFSPHWLFHPRIVNTPFLQADFDKARFGKDCELVFPGNQ